MDQEHHGSFSLLMCFNGGCREFSSRYFWCLCFRLFPEEYAGALYWIFILIAVAYIVNTSENKVIKQLRPLLPLLKLQVLHCSRFQAWLFRDSHYYWANYTLRIVNLYHGALVFIASLLSILAYKGFTTITNQGEILKSTHKNVGVLLLFQSPICTVIYGTLALSVAGGLSIEEIVVAKDYTLAAAAKPVVNGVLY
jgi:amino acid transporter